MAKTPRHILKGNNVKLEGQFHLDVGQIGTTRPKGASAALATPQARIVENHPEFAVMEITCSCGTKTYLRCEFGNAESPAENAEIENGLPQASDQTK